LIDRSATEHSPPVLQTQSLSIKLPIAPLLRC
jgi:hypothetical protein